MTEVSYSSNADTTDRAVPRCVHFGRCGGCQYQDLGEAAQQRIKTAHLSKLLTEAGLTGLPAVNVHTGGSEYGYRNRIRLRIAEIEGTMRLGYSRQSSSDFLPVTMCPIAAPGLWQAAEKVLQASETSPAVARLLRTSVELELSSNADTSQVQISFFMRGKPTVGLDLSSCGKALQAVIPELSGVGLVQLTRDSGGLGRRVERPKPIAAWGAAGLMYRVGEDTFWVSRGGFFQINRWLLPELLDLVTRGRQGRLAWDLFAGVGLFARGLARSFTEVLAVEAGEIASHDLLAGAKGRSIHPVRATTLEFLQRAVVERDRPSLIVMDPPRAGLGDQVCELLRRLKVPELVYISCDPATLARDLAHLVADGYTITAIDRFDLFPQTVHIETVISLKLV